MQRYSIPIFLAGITAIIIILGGILGGVGISKIFQRLLLFSTLMGFLGFVLVYMLEKWGIDLSSVETNITEKEGLTEEEGLEENETSVNSEVEGGDKKLESSNSYDSSFTYTVGDEEIEFKPLDESIIESSKPNEIIINGEKIQYDPKKAAAAIRQLLSEDKENE